MTLVVMYKMHQLLRFCLSMTKDNFEMFLSCTEASSAIFCGMHNVFIAFLIMHLDVRPLGKVIQGLCEPSAFVHSVKRMLQSLKRKQIRLKQLRVLLRVVGLCQQHLDTEETSHFLEAHRGRFQEYFPGLLDCLLGGLLKEDPKFQGVELQVASYADKAKHFILGPHCQCDATVNYWKEASSTCARGAKQVSKQVGKDGGLGSRSAAILAHFDSL